MTLDETLYNKAILEPEIFRPGDLIKLARFRLDDDVKGFVPQHEPGAEIGVLPWTTGRTIPHSIPAGAVAIVFACRDYRGRIVDQITADLDHNVAQLEILCGGMWLQVAPWGWHRIS